MDKKKLKSAVGWAVAIVGYYVWFQAFYNAVRFNEVLPYTDLFDMAAGVAHNFLSILAVFLLNLFIVFSLVRLKNLKGKVCADVLLSIFTACLVNWLYLWIIGAFRKTSVDWAGTILNDVIILMGVEMVYYFKRLSGARQEIEEARLNAIQYKYDALKSQINPHFLFNSLNLLYSLVSIDTIRAKQFIRELSRMYRYIMLKHSHDCVSVTEEFDYLSSYISVLEMRYNNKFSVIVNGRPDPDKYLIPFTMQLLIENVTKHNVITGKTPMSVTIDIADEEITISNPLRPKKSESVSHIGLRYLSQLYDARGRKFRVEKTDTSFTAHVPYL